MISPDLTLTSSMTSSQTSSFYTEDLVAEGKRDPKQIAGKFEALFYRLMFEQMKNTESEDPLMGSNQGKQLKGMWYDELANHLGQSNSLGIGDLILQDIEQRQGPSASPQGLVKDA